MTEDDDDIVIALRRGEDGWEYAAADEIEALRAENEKLRSILFQFAAYDESVGNVEMFTMTVPAGVIHAAADALKEAGDE